VELRASFSFFDGSIHEGIIYYVFYNGSFMKVHVINYIIISDLIMICYYIYEERDEISFIEIKLIQLISMS
jgi:hypothetical protein